MFSDDRDDADISINIDFIEKLVGIAILIVVLQYLYEIAAFDQHDDLFEADSSFSNEPGVLVRIEGVIPLFHTEPCYDDVCLLSTEYWPTGTGHAVGTEPIYSRIGRVRQRVSLSLFPCLPREWECRIEGLG